jgi:hypothetical protein
VEEQGLFPACGRIVGRNRPCKGQKSAFFSALVFPMALAAASPALSAQVLPMVLLYVHPFDVASAFLVCKAWHGKLFPGCVLWASLLKVRNLPLPNGHTAYQAFQAYWFLLRCSSFPNIPSVDVRPSLYRSAQERINYGCVLEVSAEYANTGNPRWPHLLMRIKSGMKTAVHLVKADYLGNGQVAAPVCDCFNKNVRDEGGWCSHMLVVVLLLDRTALGFENFAVVEVIPPVVLPERKAQYRHIAQYYKGKMAEKVLRRRLELVSKEMGLYEHSKMAYLKRFNLPSLHIETRPIGIRPFVAGRRNVERKKRVKVADGRAADAAQHAPEPQRRSTRKAPKKPLDDDEYDPDLEKKQRRKKNNQK